MCMAMIFNHTLSIFMSGMEDRNKGGCIGPNLLCFLGL